MADKKISEMSLDELTLYREQLNRELANVDLYYRQKIASSTKTGKEV